MENSSLYYNQPEKFTESEIEWINDLADAVSFVFGVSLEDLQGTRRLRRISDARRVICYYCYENINLKNIGGPNNVALASWFLRKHHSVVCYHVEVFDNLYMSDKNFRSQYDAVLAIMNGTALKVSREEMEVIQKELTWDDVKSNSRYTMQIKESLMPENVSSKIRSMRECGYGAGLISKYVKCGENFIRWYIKKNEIKVNPKARIFNNNPAEAYAMPKYQVKAVDY